MLIDVHTIFVQISSYTIKKFYLSVVTSHKHVWLLLRRCETPSSPPTLDQVGIENCKQLFSPLLALTTQKIATHSTDTISAVCVPFFGS